MTYLPPDEESAFLQLLAESDPAAYAEDWAGLMPAPARIAAVAPVAVRPDELSVPISAGINIDVDGHVLGLDGATVTEGGWSATATRITYNGTPRKVRVETHVHAKAITEAERASVVLELWRLGSPDVLIVSGASGYIRYYGGHTESSYDFTGVDRDPGTDPVYEMRCRPASSTRGQVVALAPSYIEAEAHR